MSNKNRLRAASNPQKIATAKKQCGNYSLRLQFSFNIFPSYAAVLLNFFQNVKQNIFS